MLERDEQGDYSASSGKRSSYDDKKVTAKADIENQKVARVADRENEMRRTGTPVTSTKQTPASAQVDLKPRGEILQVVQKPSRLRKHAGSDSSLDSIRSLENQMIVNEYSSANRALAQSTNELADTNDLYHTAANETDTFALKQGKVYMTTAGGNTESQVELINNATEEGENKD